MQLILFKSKIFNEEDMRSFVFMWYRTKKKFYIESTTITEKHNALRYTTIVAATLLKVLLFNSSLLIQDVP